MFIVRCPKCKHDMKYQPRGKVKGKKKKCVYCGHTFSVHSNLENSCIIKKV